MRLEEVTEEELTIEQVAQETGVKEDIIRRVVQSGILEGIPPQHTLRGIRKYKRKPDNETD